MRKLILYFIIAAMLVATISSCGNSGNDIPSLHETFSENDKLPFGTYVMHNQLAQLFSQNAVREKKQTFALTYDEISDTGSLYVCISKNLFLSETDRKDMLSYVSNGNTLFIAAENIDTSFLKDLGCAINAYVIDLGFIERPMSYTSVAMNPAIYNDMDKYSYFYFNSQNWFSKYDTTSAKVLGINDNGYANFIMLFYGKGRIYLHCEPRVFGNYFLLQKNNYHYLENVFAFMPETPEHVFWDDYYNNHNYAKDGKGRSGLSFLLQFPPLAWAFWLLVLMLLFFVLFNGKRRQRVIKIIPPNTNTTVAFTETVGRVYYQKKDNKNIADKMITYFFEYLRNQYFLNTSQLNDAFIDTLSRKSAVPKETVEVLLASIASIQQATKISNQQLLLLNKQIENFYKK